MATKPPGPPATPAPTTREVVDSLSAQELPDAISLLKTNCLDPSALTGQELDRAVLQGLVERLAPGAAILPGKPKGSEAPSPFRSEILDNRIGYLRLGALTGSTPAELDAALKNFTDKELKSVILDLRATPPGNDFDQAAEVAKRFCPKGKLLFRVIKPSSKQERILTSNRDPGFQGLVMVLVDNETAGSAEVIAAVLRLEASAMIIGDTTKGQAVEFADLPLGGGKLLRLAVSKVVLPENVEIFPKGVKPDLTVPMPPDVRREVMQLGLEKGVSPLVFETGRQRFNEAALVAGTNPDIDDMESLQHSQSPEHPPVRDTVLQRAVDLITTIGIYQSKPSQTGKSARETK